MGESDGVSALSPQTSFPGKVEPEEPREEEMEAKGRDAPSAPANSEAPPPLTAAENPAEAPRRRAGAPKRKASSNLSSTPSKRLVKERIALNLIPTVHNGPCTRARQSPNKIAGAGHQNAPEAASAEVGGKALSVAGGPIGAEEEELVPLEEPVVDAEFDAVRSRGSEVHVVPTPAGWFSWKEIHPVEKHALASFFNGKSESRTPEIYTEIRNSIMRKFHANPQTQLELKDLSELSVGDSDARQEVMEFLDHWGLINFHPFPLSNPDASNSDTREDKSSSLIEKLYQFETVQSCPRSVPRKVEMSSPAVMPRFFPESAMADDLVRPVGPSVEYHCNSCSADCSRKRYHCQKQADFDLCMECYNNGKFGSGMAPADFILMEPAEVPGVSGGSWTDQETLLLLEALELFGENWNEIAEHVATKTKAQCILHFLQMPIEDTFLEGNDDVDDTIQKHMDPGSADKETTASDVPETKETENAEEGDQPVSSPTDVLKRKDACESEVSCETGDSIAIDALKAAFQAIGYMPEQGGLLSFAEAGNPVMALAAFLTHLVEPDAAATSSRSSLKARSEDSPGIQLATRHCFLLEDPPSDGKDPPACESGVPDLGSGEAPKEEDQMPISNGNDESKDCTDKNEESAVPVENEKSSSVSLQDCLQNLPAPKESGDSVLPLEAAPGSTKDSDDPTLPGEQIVPSAVKDATDSSSPVVLSSSNSKELGDLASEGEVAPSATNEINDLEPAGKDKPNPVKESGTSVDQVVQISDTSVTPDTRLTSAPPEEGESQQKAVTGSILESTETADGDDKKVSPSNDGKNWTSAETNDDRNINRLKRAAVTVLSAAAVKAKLLANQEEDQIRQLVSLIIEKQLHKLETKLALFTEIESVILRVREQTDRARHRLIHERAQIIAARLGLPAPSARANPPSLPASKFAMGYGTTGSKPLTMSSQKPPPMRRP